MNCLEKIKLAIIRKSMLKKKNQFFDAAALDVYTLPKDAGPLENNSWFFGGDSLEGESLTMRLAYRNTGFSEVFVTYRDKEGRWYNIDKQLFPTDETPMSVENVIPGRDWIVRFDGILNDTATGEALKCKFDLKFTARLPIFYPMHDGWLDGMAQAFATQKWNKAFFASLKSDTGMGGSSKGKANGSSKGKANGGSKTVSQQYHYEQIGRTAGTMQLGDRTIQIDLAGIRDRAFGRRDWNYMDSHIWLVAVTGNGEVMNISVVNYPNAKKFNCGYTDINSDRYYAMTSYKILDWDWNDGKGPDVAHFEVSFENGKTYPVTVTRVNDFYTPFDNGNFYFHEAIGDFQIGDIKARGTIEYGFNKDRSRWGSF